MTARSDAVLDRLTRLHPKLIDLSLGRIERLLATRDDGSEPGAEEVSLELEDLHIMDLADAYEHIMASIDFSRLGDHVVEMDDTPVALHQEDLLDRLHRAEDGRLIATGGHRRRGAL